MLKNKLLVKFLRDAKCNSDLNFSLDTTFKPLVNKGPYSKDRVLI